MPYDPVAFLFGKEDAETGEGAEEVGHDGVRGLKHLSCVEKRRQVGLFSPRKGRHRAVQKQVTPSWRDDDGVTLFCSGRWHGRGNSHKVPPGSFPLGLRKN